MANSNRFPTSRIVLIGVMAAMIVVVTFFRFPLLGSKIHFANAMCLLAGLLLGPVGGGLAAGIGSFLYDVLFGGYDILQAIITFVSKFAMAWLCAIIALHGQTSPRPPRIVWPVLPARWPMWRCICLKPCYTRPLCTDTPWIPSGLRCSPSSPPPC